MTRNFRFVIALAVLAIAAGCTIPLPPGPSPSPNVTVNTTSCGDKTCLIAAANSCRNLSLTLTEDSGVFAYSVSDSCVLTKTLVSLNDNESQEMKTLLEGKGMNCSYSKGGFDSRLVGSLLYGIDNCEGELKDDLGRLVIFTSD